MQKRNLALDGMRGIFLVIMAVNHLFGGYIRQVTSEPLGMVSAAEGFVMLSGVVFAMVYGQRQHYFQQSFQRAWYVYRWQVAGVLAIFALVLLLPSIDAALWRQYFNTGAMSHAPWQALVATLTMTYVPANHDVLVIYIVSLVLAPAGIWLLRRGLGWLWLVISAVIWLAAKWLNQDMLLPIYQQLLPGIAPATGYFDVLAWQLLFQIGLVLGYWSRHKQVDFVLAKPWQNIAVVSVIIAVAVVWQLHKKTTIAIPLFAINDTLWGNNTPGLGLLRIANALLLAYGAMLLVRFAPRVLSLRYFVFLGQHSIAVFVFHAVAVYILATVTHPLVINSFAGDLAFSVFFAVLLLIPASLHQRWQNWRAR